MFRDVVLPGMDVNDWQAMRGAIHDRIFGSMGVQPTLTFDPKMEVTAESECEGLHLRHFRFSALPGMVTHGAMVLPADIADGVKRPAVLCMHGTDEVLAHRNVISPKEKPDRRYALDLAHRGMVTMTVDQFAFGAGNAGRPQAEVIQSFYEEYPQWSLDGVRVWIHRCALDLLAAEPAVDSERFACIGHSLGGRAAVYQAALDVRIKAAVPSAGISPNLTNVYRNRPGPQSLSPKLDDSVDHAGLPAWEYQEMLALIAPRAVLLIEPWHDPYNPMIESVFRCFERARFVFQLCGAADNLQMLTHGDGHNTTKNVREYAFTWLAEKLNWQAPSGQ